MKNYKIVIKFNKSAIQSRNNDALTLKSFATLDNFLNQFTYRSVVTDEMLFPQEKINTVNFENLVGICYVQGLGNVSLEEKKILSEKMAAYDCVEYAYVTVPPQQPLLPIHRNAKNENTATYKTRDAIPDFTQRQGYKDGIETDHIGIDMEYAWSQGITGQGVRCAVLEMGFADQHINLKRGSFITLGHLPVIIDTNHGTATSGIIYANDISFGVKGLVHGADKFYAVLANPDFMSPLLELYQYLEAGDVISISYSYPDGPLDISPFDWDAFKTGLEAGILISISAGNDNFNLDDSDGGKLDEWHKRPDIGIIHAGAGNKKLCKQAISNYGSMVNLQAWGNDVVTTGYGDLYSDEPNNQYTKDFGGTSAASPIIASAVVAVQSWYKQQTGNVLTPFEMRELLVETGLSQSDPENGHIGPIPNIRNAINELRRRLSLNKEERCL